MPPANSRRVPALVVLVLALGACATWSKHGVGARAPEKIRIAVLPARVSVKVRRLSRIETVATPPADEKAAIRRGLGAAADAITADLEADLARSYFFAVIPDSDVRRALAAQGVDASTSPLTAAQLQAVGRSADAEVVLATTLSGYGAIKTRWLVYLVGSGLAEGLAQGVAAAVVLPNAWAAAAIGAEEAAQETTEWVGGAYVFGRFWSPVVLEGSLVSAADGRALWSSTSLESRGEKRALKALPKSERVKREVRLRLTARRAAASLVESLDKRAWRNLKDREAPPAAE